METRQLSPVTHPLRRWRSGQPECLGPILRPVHDELQRIARKYRLMGHAGHTLQTTAPINEAYLRVVDQARVPFEHRVHFSVITLRLMRHILVDHARGLRPGKHGGGQFRLPHGEELVYRPSKSAELVALDEALTALANFDAREAKDFELRYFSVEEAAETLSIHTNSVIRDLSLARAWLKRKLGGMAAHGSGTLG